MSPIANHERNIFTLDQPVAEMRTTDADSEESVSLDKIIASERRVAEAAERKRCAAELYRTSLGDKDKTFTIRESYRNDMLAARLDFLESLLTRVIIELEETNQLDLERLDSIRNDLRGS